MLANWFISREMGKVLKVALCGDGADELFGGYEVPLQSAVQHLGQGSGSLLGSFMLHELPDHRLGGMPRLALAAMALALTLPPMLIWVQRRLAGRAGFSATA